MGLVVENNSFTGCRDAPCFSFKYCTKKSLTRKKKSPARKREPLIEKKKSSTGKKKSLTGKRKSLARKREPSAGKRKSPTGKKKSPTGKRKSPARKRESSTKTSADHQYWQKDARYSYYKHGPLARTILGQQQVQGVDYAYTLQGWLKGINSTAVGNGTYDIGSDGKAGSLNANVARDVYGFSLNYYSGDYKPINLSAQGSFVTNTLGFTNSDSKKAASPLYNGNIASMLVNVPKLGEAHLYAYRYDQLNRIVSMDALTGLNNTTGLFTPQATDSYKERVSYDANGNIKTYKRNGNAARLTMDDMVYSYKANTNQLDKVVDNAADAAAGEYDKYNDLKRTQPNGSQGQQSGNYTYDAIGNLTSDVSEGISNISWTVYGKIGSVTKTNGTTVSYTYDASGNRVSKTVVSQGLSKTTYYVRDASGNVMALYEKRSDLNSGNLTQTEVHLYGSSRLGILNVNRDVQTAPVTTGSITFETGNKFFELSNHLGNVLVTISDKKRQHSSDGITVDYYYADVASANDYYPGGMLMPGRKYGTLGRYGFNGKEQDSEVKGEGAQYDYGFRIYDPRVVRFLSVDPLFQTYPWYTPYQFAGNMPIWAIDLDGLEEMKANSVANVIKDINGNIITKPTVINDQSSSADIIPGVRRLNSNQIEVTPGLIGEKHPYWNTFTWQQVNGKDFYCNQSITPIGQEAGGTVKPPKTNLQQDNDDVPPPAMYYISRFREIGIKE